MDALKMVVLMVGAVCAVALCTSSWAADDSGAADFPTAGTPNAEALGWHFGCQAYSFNRFTFFEAVDKVASMGLHYIEAYPGQKLSKDTGEAKFHHDMSEEHRKLALDYLKEKDVKLMNYGVVGMGDDEASQRKVFEFAKAMGIETICTEPNGKQLPELDKLANEYEINIALHNHPRPSRYWNYETVLRRTRKLSKRVGACADIGHWMRSDIDPLEALKALEGRIISFHFKDLNKYGEGAHDVPWGTGKADVKALLKEIKRQGLEAVFSAEYEYHWENSVPEIAQGMAYVDKVAAELSK